MENRLVVVRGWRGGVREARGSGAMEQSSSSSVTLQRDGVGLASASVAWF